METQITEGEEVKDVQDQGYGKTICVDLGITKNEAGEMSERMRVHQELDSSKNQGDEPKVYMICL